MKLILRNQIIKTAQNQQLKGQQNSRGIIAFTLASVVTGVNYFFQNFITAQDNQRQKQLIQRVSNDQTATNFLYDFDYHKADDWECKKITLDGTLKEGRFLVKRNRGNQQGYIVLAPFTVQRDRPISTKRKVQRKFVLNLGWIPKHSKHLVKTMSAADSIGQNTYTAQNRIQAIQKQKYDSLSRDPVNLAAMTTVTTVQAYIRRGQERQILNGLNNFRDQKLYKFIDLQCLTRLFRITNSAEASVVYLERIPRSEEQSQVAPIPTNKSHVIEDLKQRIELNNQTRKRNILGVSIGAFGTALLSAMI